MNKEDAIEAWNTWKGRYKDPELDKMQIANPCNECADFIDENGAFKSPPKEKQYKKTQMYNDGTFGISWPLLPHKIKILNGNNQLPASIDDIIGYRARWCALFTDINDYRKSIVQILKANDHDNTYLNSILNKWNIELENRGFIKFQRNDLRGINLCALDLSGDKFDGINIRKIDFSYSELSFAQLVGANTYGSTFNYCDAYGINLSFSISAEISINHSMFSNSKFIYADVSQSNIKNSIFYNSNLEGINLSKSEINVVNFSESSFSEYEDQQNMKHHPTNLDRTKVTECNFSNIRLINNSIIISESLINEIQQQNQNNKKISEIWNSIELKPGVFGFSIDLKRFFKGIFRK